MDINFQSPVINTIKLRGHAIDVLRLDTIHPVVSGNKWYKLKGYVDHLLTYKQKGFVTFGGAFSNHLHAAAFVGNALGLATIAYIRGGEDEVAASKTLQDCAALDMQFRYLSRSEYKQKATSAFISQVEQQFPDYLIIPEGGSGALGELGVHALKPYIQQTYDLICVSVGSGTTLKGLLQCLHPHQQILGFAPMKLGAYLHEVLNLDASVAKIVDEFHFGGFGKYNDALIAYMNQVYNAHQLPTDMVYTAKMFYGMEQLMERGIIKQTQKILAIHTGGLQGNIKISERLMY